MNILIKTGQAFYGLAIAAIGFQQFFYGDFRPVLLPPWPSGIHGFAIWAYLCGAALIIAGGFILLGKKTKIVSLYLGGFFLLLFAAFHVPYLLFINQNSPRHLGLWTDPLKELALSGGAFVIAGSLPKEKSNDQKKYFLIKLLEKIIPLGSIFFSITMISFGIDHFLYTDFVASLVPAWFTDNIFWTYFAGVGLIGSGVAIILKIRLKTIGILLGTMIFLWFVFLHIPRAIAEPLKDNGNEVTSVFEALGFSGIAFVIAMGIKEEKDME